MKNNEIKAGIKHLCKNDETLCRIIKRYDEVNLKENSNYLVSLVTSIINQQLSVKAAATIEARFMKLAGSITAERILELQTEDIRACGISGSKVNYIKNIATAIVEGNLNFANYENMSSEAIAKELTAIKGIGKWTSDMFLMFTMYRLDILPTGDQGIKQAVKLVYGLETLPTEKEIEHICENNGWQPYATIACLYLWKFLDNE